jgi:hypothetical protein
MDDPNAEREAHQEQIAPTVKPGRIIVLGAAAMAFGALMIVKVLGAYIALAGQAPELDNAEMQMLRTPEKQWALWVTFIESAFLFAAGFGLVKLQRTARPLFFALAITRLCLFIWFLTHLSLSDSTLVFVFSVMKTFGLYGFGVWLLLRPGTAELFEPKPE